MGFSIQLLAAELQRYVVQNKKVNKSDFGRATTVAIDQYCKKVTKIKGSYQVLDSVMSHVVQGFEPVWQELGNMSVKDKELKNYHQKVNFAIVPATVLSTALADWYEEGIEPTNKMICKVIIDWLLTQVTDDLELLSMIGVYDAQQASGAFGYSIKGWNAIISDLLVNTVRPCFKIPLDTITDENIYDVFEAYELALPKKLKGKIKEIHTSTRNVERYGIRYRNKWGNAPKYDEQDRMKSPLLKRILVGHDDMADDVLFATIDGNMYNLIDAIDNPPQITDVQIQDYKLKIFMEFWKGWDTLINEAVCVADFSGEVRGLGNDTLMGLYYPHDAIDDAA